MSIKLDSQMFYYNYYKKLFKTYLKHGRTSNGHPKKYRDIGIINPSIGTCNLGDLIIYDAVYSCLRELFPDAFFTTFPSQFHTSYDAKEGMSKKDLLFVAGTNLLSSNMNEYYQWKLDPGHKRFINNKVVLMGVGWWQYQDLPNAYTQRLLKEILCSDTLHSVRDNYTFQMLRDIGINNVINTSCPTLWSLTEEKCRTIPKNKADNVVTALTFYKYDEAADRKLLEILRSNYDKVYLWIQGVEDYDYLKRIYSDYAQIILIPPSLEAYDQFLMNEPSVEYLGTRLHAGARALQKGKRTLIVAVDNRAIEIGKDVNLNVIKRTDLYKVTNYISSSYSTDIQLPIENINRWKEDIISFDCAQLI